jgi:F0F1-type ATP synthase membrane subunit a
VFAAVTFFGIEERGLGNYLKSYAQPTPIMLPFNIISEISRTLALAVRLFGNMMSGAMIIGILAHHHALFLPGDHVGAGTSHRHGAGVYLLHSGHGLHCGRDACPRT